MVLGALREGEASSTEIISGLGLRGAHRVDIESLKGAGSKLIESVHTQQGSN